ncbi:MAG: RHS repeat-associated core domain-containing protein, partial [Desulfobacterales bacterium]|nr:RHS repeat-associated core domain-containing protein [Desulfobacterales bacterium]
QRGMMTDYDYDGNGSRTLVSTPSGSTSYTYDKRNRLKTAGAAENRRRKKQQGPDDPPDKKATASYTYTPDGKPDTVTYISGASVKYNYNDQNRTESITHRSGTGEIISRYEYTYDKNGNRKTLTETQNGITEETEYNYDAADRLEDYTVRDSQSITATKYSYEGYNRKSENVGIIFFGPTEENIEELKNEDVPEEVTGKLAGLAGIEFATEDSFLNALKLAIGEADTAFYSPVIFKAAQGEKPLTAREYEYEDNSDQLKTVTHTDWIETTDDTDPDNPVTVRTPVTKTLSYTYDNNGSTVTKTDSLNPSDSLTFDYDARNRTVRIMKNGTEAGLYDYNAYGMKVRHYSGGRGDVDYYYDGSSVIEERKTDGSLLAHYRYADRLFRLDTQTGSQYYHHDALGSTVNLTGSDGSAVVSYRLDPWGKIRVQTGITVNRHIFTGQEYDENTGLIYFDARYYDPEIARFTAQDAYLGELGIPPSLHRYTYVYSNPTVYIDLFGYQSEHIYESPDDIPTGSTYIKYTGSYSGNITYYSADISDWYKAGRLQHDYDFANEFGEIKTMSREWLEKFKHSARRIVNWKNKKASLTREDPKGGGQPVADEYTDPRVYAERQAEKRAQDMAARAEDLARELASENIEELDKIINDPDATARKVITGIAVLGVKKAIAKNPVRALKDIVEAQEACNKGKRKKHWKDILEDELKRIKRNKQLHKHQEKYTVGKKDVTDEYLNVKGAEEVYRRLERGQSSNSLFDAFSDYATYVLKKEKDKKKEEKLKKQVDKLEKQIKKNQLKRKNKDKRKKWFFF